MASAISSEPGDRQSLSTYRSIGATFASVIVGALIPLIAYKEKNKKRGKIVWKDLLFYWYV